MEKATITNKRFAQLAARMASNASSWAADCLDSEPDERMWQEALDRFTARIEAFLSGMRNEP